MIDFLVKKTRGQLWLWIGVLSYLGAAISSIIRSIEPVSIGSNLYMAVDWFAACIPYFFFGAAFGLLADWMFAKRRHEKLKFPLWFWLSVIFYFGSIIIIAIFSKPGLLSPALIIFFPLAFCIFFNGEAFVLLAPDVIEKSFFGKLVFDLIYFALFSTWLYLNVYKKESYKNLRLILLIIIFLVLILGFGGCVHFLSK